MSDIGIRLFILIGRGNLCQSKGCIAESASRRDSPINGAYVSISGIGVGFLDLGWISYHRATALSEHKAF
jgi:hypothetical protein